MKILHNHIGYALGGRKRVLVQGSAPLASDSFTVFDATTREALWRGPLRHCGSVSRWRDWRYWEGDFSALATPGRVFASIDGAAPPLVSAPFRIAADLYDGQLMSDLLHYFKSQRCSGVFDRADRHCPIFGSSERVDVHGGWYDASGDTSKYLSHLSYANFMNPQQTPQLVWNLIEGRAKGPSANLWLDDRMVDEALHGADFLLRMQHPDGYFFMTVFDRWTKDVQQRMVCSYTTQQGHRFDTYQAGFRQGAGSAIAALARASGLPRDGEHPRPAYLAAAERGFAHLQLHNRAYLDDGVENIIDDYCALLAANELFAATGNDSYRDAAQSRALRLVDRQHAHGWFWADDAALCAELRVYAQGALDWIFGFNPFDACMMQGHGHHNPRYEAGYWNAPGGVCNGITSGLADEDDIDFKSPSETDPSQSWRWSEQWLPHGAWLFLALAQRPSGANTAFA